MDASTGEWLTRGTVWLALSSYVAGEAARTFSRSRGEFALSRAFNTLGCVVFSAHVVFAFKYFHHWSHAAAYEETARQTGRVTGWSWGGGLFINYAFWLAWIADVAASWARPGCLRRRPAMIDRILRGFFLFMIFNGAFVFARPAVRWFGLLLCVALAACWLRRRRERAERSATTSPLD